jgi:hypothetical protein
VLDVLVPALHVEVDHVEAPFGLEEVARDDRDVLEARVADVLLGERCKVGESKLCIIRMLGKCAIT